MEPEQLDTEAVKDNETVVSDSPSHEEVVVPPKSTNRNNILIAFVLIAIAALIVGLSVGLTRPVPLPHVAPIMEDSGLPGLEYELATAVSSVGSQGFFGDDEKLAFIDTETGCVQVMTYDSEMSDLLCNGFEEILSVSLSEEFAVVAHDDTVEVWRDTDYSSWVPYPSDEKINEEAIVAPARNPVMRNSDPGFGKKTAMFFNMVFVASDNHVYLYQKHGRSQWSLLHRWRAVGFDINTEQTTVAIYTRTDVKVYDLTHVSITDKLGHPKHHKYHSERIVTVVVSKDDVHVVVDAPFSSFSVIHINAAYITDLGMPAAVAGDALVSLNTGCLIDISSGTYFSIEVEDADEVFSVHAFGNRLSVFLSRDGENMVEIFEKSTPSGL